MLSVQSIASFGLPVLRLCVWLALLSAIFVPLERLFALHTQPVFRKAVLTDLCFYFISSLAPAVLLGLPLALLVSASHAVIPGAYYDWVGSWPAWVRLPAAVLVAEAGFYWGHRWSHEIPLLWRFHAVHHSAEQLDWLVNTRVHPVDEVFTRLCGLVPLAMLGLVQPGTGGPTVIALIVLLIGTMWGFFIHANLRWRCGPFEWLVATPAFHRWHHTNDGPDVINKNYAPFLPLMDRVFGTLYLPRDALPQRYGIDAPVPGSF